MNMKKANAWILIFCLVCGNYLPVARADDSDIFGQNIEPNVMIFVDTSGSMNDEIGTPISYNHNTTYCSPSTSVCPATYTSTVVYKKSGSSYTLYANNVASVTDSNARNALNSVGFWSGKISKSNVQLFLGNYLNYQGCGSCDGVEPKIVIAKRVITNLLQNTEGVRFGLMRFENNGSQTSPAGTGKMVSQIGTDVTTMVNALNAMTASGWTPLGEAVDDINRYFGGNTLRDGNTYSSPIQYSCQPNFTIVITDGMWNGNVDPQPVATTLYTTDHFGTASDGKQNVIVDTVGFNLTGSDLQAVPVLQTMAKNGGGAFYTADNSVQLEQSLQNAISQILAATFSFATPTIPTTGTSGATRAYLASFQSDASRPFWKGFLKAYDLVNGTLPVDPVTSLPSGTPVWDAGKQLSDTGSPVLLAGNRKIKTYIGGSLQDFKTTTSAITYTVLGAADNTEKDQIINYIRGAVDYNDEDGDTNITEERPWRLGDIFHSTPVVVSPPFLRFMNDSTYDTFKTAQKDRTTIMLAGANDGMLHAIKESDGTELWAFIPPNLLDQLKHLKALSGTRDYYVDSSPIVADVKTGSPATWKTIAVFGERRGGNTYYALDVTDTSNPPLYLWSFSDTRLGETWSEPAIGKVKMADGTDKWVAFFGGGYDTTNANYSSGNKTTEAFFAIDLSSGAKLWEYYNDGTADDRQYMNFSIPAAPTAVDLNNDGYIDRVYIGDVGGQLWKFDVAPTGGATLSGSLINNWTVKRLFAATSSPTNPPGPAPGEFYPTEAIFSWPVLAYDASHNLWIFFGTGDRYHPNSSSTNRFYGIKENTTMANGSALTESSLTNMSGGTGTVTQGWYLAFSTDSGEKVMAAAEVFHGVVFFTTFTPVTAAVCGTGGGNAKLYSVNMNSGDAALNLDTGDVLAAHSKASDYTKSIGTGIPSKPVIVTGATGVVITSTTSQMVKDTDTKFVPNKTLMAWREVFQ
jgi:type IV pilus assembly protein PilY1